MSTLIFAFAVALLGCCVVLVENRSYDNGLIFYDLQTHQAYLPPTVSASRGRILSSVKYSDMGSIWSTFGKPCDCKGNHCGCCAGIKIERFRFDQKMCANVSFVPSKEEVAMDISLDDKIASKYGISARNPSPICIPVMLGAPLSMCVQLSDIAIKGNNLNMCMDVVMQLGVTDIFEMHFQCMRMGLDGIQYLDKNGQPVIPPGSSKTEEAVTAPKADHDDDDDDYYYQEAEQAAESENEIATNVGSESENETPSESVADKMYEAAGAQQQQKMQQQMQKLQQQSQQQLAASQPAPAEMEIEQESEMSNAGTTTATLAIAEDEEAAAVVGSNSNDIGSTIANDPQQNEIIDAITITQPAATSAAPLTTTISLESLERLSDAATDTIKSAAAAASMLVADTKTEVDVETMTAGEAATANANNASSDNAGDAAADSVDDDNDAVDVDADAAEEEDYSAAADNYEADASAADATAESGSVNNDSVSEVENLGVAAAPANVAAAVQLPAAAYIGETDLEAMASAADATATAIVTPTATAMAIAAQESEAAVVNANLATPRMAPPAHSMTRYRQRYG